MLFNSLAFLLLFFPVTTLVYCALPHRFRWAWLLGASCYFYMSAVPVYICILGLTITVDFVAALKIEASQGHARRVYFGISVASTVLILFVFKYFNFVNDNVAALARAIGWNYSIGALRLALPLGLSFHTFQSLAYVIEVYRGEQKAERHFGIYALYVMFYPQLVAGPIERPQNLLHQFREEHVVDARQVLLGIRRIVYGLFKKVIVADSLARYVDAVYANLPKQSALPVALAAVAFSIQMYGDFSGYSDIAVGTAQTMGFRLMENFERPFLASSLSEFWRRWHRSLSTWFNDYVFLPLHTSLRDWGKAGLVVAIMTTFVLSGVWHGAAWTFAVWGGLHGVALVCEALTRRWRKRFASLVGKKADEWIGLVSSFAFVTFALIFFRARSFAEAWRAIVTILEHKVTLSAKVLCAGLEPSTLMFSLGCIGALALSYRLPNAFRSQSEPAWLQTATLAVAFVFVVLHLNLTSRFIYFAF